MLCTRSHNWPGPSLLRRLTSPSSMTDGRITLAAALTEASSSSSLAAYADRSGKSLKALCLTLSTHTMICSCWSPHRPGDPTGTRPTG